MSAAVIRLDRATAGGDGTGGGIAVVCGGGAAAAGADGAAAGGGAGVSGAGVSGAGSDATRVGVAGRGRVAILGRDGGAGSEAARTVPTAPIAAAERNHKPIFMSRLADPSRPDKKATVELTPIRQHRETIGRRSIFRRDTAEHPRES
jgi:hypothetical protein